MNAIAAAQRARAQELRELAARRDAHTQKPPPARKGPRSALSHARTYPFTTVIATSPFELGDPRLAMPGLADNECPHGRLPGDKVEQTDPCGCWRPVVSA